MRIKIRDQLSALVLLLALCCVGIPSLISWVHNYHFVVNLRTNRLALVAGLKAEQLSQAFDILQNSIASVSSRLIIQHALDLYNNNTDVGIVTSPGAWQGTITDVAVALDTQPYLLQATLWNTYLNQSLVNVVGEEAIGINGITPTEEYLAPGPQPAGAGYSWNGHMGFPDELYPRAAHRHNNESRHDSYFTPGSLQQFNVTFQGPVKINNTLYLASYTVPVFDQSQALPQPLLGFLTVVVDARILVDIVNRRLALDETGIMLVVGPDNPTNLWSGQGLTDETVTGDTSFRFALPAYERPNIFNISGPMSAWQTVLDLYHMGKGAPAHADLSVRDVSNHKFSVGYVLTNVPYVDWGVIIAQSYDEVLSPVNRLRDVLLATVFGTCGVVLLLVWPLAHLFVRPITRLSDATSKHKRDLDDSPIHGPPGAPGLSPTNSHEDIPMHGSNNGHADAHRDLEPDPPDRRPSNALKSAVNFVMFKRGFNTLYDPNRRYLQKDDSRNTFRIPSKVPERRHLIHDELTDLTHKFNRMTEELEQQYETLEERVRQRTVQLEEQRQLAETANEAKSRFIANITHELRTPLNGILGMCAVCLADDDIFRIKQSLGIVYKSGELLLHLLTDLLTFSRTQISTQAINLDFKRFRISDITSQVLAIFDKQARDGKISLGVTTFPETVLQDMVLLGDSNRVLQIIINLISNALKFTPENGSIHLTITLVDEVRPKPLPQQSFPPSPRLNNSRDSSQNRARSGVQSKHSNSDPRGDFTSEKNTVVKTSSLSTTATRKRSSLGSETELADANKTYIFEFRVQDTGPGIPADQQDQIFEPFVQGELGLNRKYGGTGLGLSICKELSKLMGGNISLQSAEGEGSTFTLRIPLKSMKDGRLSNHSSRENSVSYEQRASNEGEGDGTAAVRTEKGALDPTASSAERVAAINQPRLVGYSKPYFAPSSEPPTGPKAGTTTQKVLLMNGDPSKLPLDAKSVRVLVAEDNKINQEVVIRMLKLEHIENITLAGDGQEAVDRIKEAITADEAFHIVFMDVQMPNLDGLESTRIIREMGYDAPIVALSAFTEESNIKECYECGMNYFLSKPIRRPALKKVLRTYCAPIQEETTESAVKAPEQPQRSKSEPMGEIPTATTSTDPQPPAGPTT